MFERKETQQLTKDRFVPDLPSFFAARKKSKIIAIDEKMRANLEFQIFFLDLLIFESFEKNNKIKFQI